MRCVTLLLFAFAMLSSKAHDAPVHLRVNDITAPVGTSPEVYFGWWFSDSRPSAVQTKYQIRIASSAERLASTEVSEANIWDSGTVVSRAQNHVGYGGPPLCSDTRYYWQVRTWDADSVSSPWSAIASFTVGLNGNEDWEGAQWIRRESSEADDYTYYRHSFEVPDGIKKQVIRATLYISAVHHYALYLNGALVAKGQAYHYPQYQYYRAYDVSDTLRVGEPNQLAVFTHWFGGGQGRPSSERGLIAKLIIHYADGSTSQTASDETWRVARSEAWRIDDLTHRNRGEGVGYIERIDGRRLLPNWAALDFDDSDWGTATSIGPHPTAPWTGELTPELTRIVEYPLRPEAITITPKGSGKYVVDLGKVYAGLPQIYFSGGQAGERIALRGGYTLNTEGEIAPGTISQNTLMEYEAVLSEEPFTFEPVEYLGMRYLQIDNAPMPLTHDNFAFIVRHATLVGTASDFESSDPTLNAVWDLMKHSLYTCAHEAFLDTPTREKGGFLGDSVIQSTVAMPVLQERALTRRTLGEFIQSMEHYWRAPEDRGRINAVYPNGDGARDIPDFTQAYLTWVWAYYMETGDRAFLEKNYPYLSEIGGYLGRHISTAHGLVCELRGGNSAYLHGIIDWTPTMRFDYDVETATRTVINAWAYADFQILAQIAEVLQKPDDAQHYTARASALGKAINQHLRDKASGLYHDGLYANGSPSANTSQHANMMPLALGLVPEAARAAVREHVRAQGMSVGMVTVSWLLRALGEAGEGTALLELLTNAEQPGWARSLARGATATWESWFADEHGESLSHAWGAAGMEAYYRYILGIRPLSPQYEHILIQPLDFGTKLSWAEGKIMTERGPISVRWEREAVSYTLRLKIPANTTAEVRLPTNDGSQSPQVLGAGLHVLRMSL